MKKFLLFLLITVSWKMETVNCFAQPYYTRTDSIKVKVNGNFLKMPWVGGHNHCQFSDLDMNFDGIKDLFVFDRTGHKVTTYINGGTPNTIDYYDSTSKYASKFPHLEDWVLIRDYNCDGLPDIFTYGITVGGIKVWRNTSSGGNLQFTLQTPYVKSNYNPSVANLYVSRVDIPTIDDVDGDGDLDVLSFDFSGIQLEFHINKSKELGYGCDSLIFQLDGNGCWGNFQENPLNCNVNLGSTCRVMNPDSLHANHLRKKHAGSCSVCIDMDDDGDKEILLGDLSCCNMTMLTNGGSPLSANMISKDTSFPSTNIPINISIFPCGYFVDVNNDKNRDLIVSPNTPSLDINNESIWYYENTGTDSTPVFQRKKRNFLQEDMIDVGEGANPIFFDFNGDGLSDILISNNSMLYDTCTTNDSYNVYAYKNIGTASNPRFELVDTNYANIDGQFFTSTLYHMSGKHLTFGDIDNDADADLFVGDFDGKIHYYMNTASTGNPANFVLTTPYYLDDTNIPIDVGNFATPQLIDADRDNDLDLIIGERWGNLNYYENTGTVSTPTFTLTSSSFGGVDVMTPCCTGYSVPFMYDSAGSYRLFVASEAYRNYPATGWIWYYKNIDGNLAGNFTLVDSMYQNIWEGERMTINGKNINNDGSMDLIIGNYCGGAVLYMGDSSPITGISELINEASFGFTIYPNPFSESIIVEIIGHQSSGIGFEFIMYDVFGREVMRLPITDNRLLITRGNLANGVYSCVVKTDKFSKAKKLVVLK